MNSYCVVLADALRARIFTLEPADVPALESGPNLVERRDLVNPEREMPERDLWSDAKSGRNRTAGGAAQGGAAHGYDDHREKHAEEIVARFARETSEAVAEVAAEQQASQLVLVAESRMLGLLRPALGVALKGEVKVQEVAKNLSKLSPTELHTRLADEGFLPKRQRPGS
jgi:protein required for attachment to host cells